MDFMSDEWLKWLKTVGIPSMDDYMAWSDKVNAIKDIWPSDLQNVESAKRFMAQSECVRPGNTHALMLWHELRAACLETLERFEDAEREALAADALYEQVRFASCWGQPWQTLIAIALRKDDFDAARQWVERAQTICRRLRNEFGRPNDASPWDAMLDEIARAEAFKKFADGVLQDLREATLPVVQSEFCKSHRSQQPDMVRAALYELERRCLIRRQKHGRSYLIHWA